VDHHRPGHAARASQDLRQFGVAVNDEEMAYDLRSIAMRGYAGEVLAAVNVAVNATTRSSEGLMAQLCRCCARRARSGRTQGFQGVPGMGRPQPRRVARR
jgi:DNA-binding IclR family transcriptional regulator